MMKTQSQKIEIDKARTREAAEVAANCYVGEFPGEQYDETWTYTACEYDNIPDDYVDLYLETVRTAIERANS